MNKKCVAAFAVGFACGGRRWRGGRRTVGIVGIDETVTTEDAIAYAPLMRLADGTVGWTGGSNRFMSMSATEKGY